MKEPAWTFIDELQKPVHQQKPAFWQPRPARSGELSLTGGLALHQAFADPAGVLETAWADFARFCSVLDLNGQNGEPTVPLEIRQAETDGPEAFRLRVGPDGIQLEAADTEGIRRGIVQLEDLILAAGAPVLPLGTTEKQPFVRTRLSRCFFGPIKRPPMNRDELEDQVNYYPDEYLNRLAHEGVNALWLTITFRDTVPITVLPGFGRRADVHLPKLRETVRRCARYGIRIYVFFIEPTAFMDDRDNVRYLDIKTYEKDYPELIGNRQSQMAGFCPSSELARSFLYEATNTLFTQVPGLGGMIDISVGERFTHCASWYNGMNNCPRCSVRKPYEVLADVLDCLQRGMHDANPAAEFISWPYSQYLLWGDEGTVEAAGHVPHPVVLQHNFESSGLAEQLGRTRRADDYWLSYTGPSALYRRCAEMARQNGTRMFAKLQVGCSHEVASVTHVPVPGILYDKYSRMRELGVSGAMQSWYFGNYPSLMTRAAGRLSFEPWSGDKDAFLNALALPDWGPHSETVTRAWNRFQEAYAQYPIYHVFGYYAPVHDGPVWPLYLFPVDMPLIPNWKFMPEFPEHGDRIGECLQEAFTLDEALLLCSRMSRTWHEGLLELEKIEPFFSQDLERRRDINTARALDILFDSCCNILRFYQLREILADLTGEPALACLEQLRQLIRQEIANSQALADCCQLDPALGFNSEHEGYRFYPDKLAARVDQLETCLARDVPVLKDRLARGLLPYPAWTGQEPDRPAYRCHRDGTAEPEVVKAADGQIVARFSAAYDDDCLTLTVGHAGPPRDFQVRFFPQRLWPERTYQFAAQTGKTILRIQDPLRPPQAQQQLETDVTTGSDTTVQIRLPLDELQRPAACRTHPLRFNVLIAGDVAGRWVWRDAIAHRLAQSPINPDEYGWLQFA